MPDHLYDADILAWSEQQADLLRRLARGERVNDAIDWANVVDEVETVGRSELQECESLLLQAMLHLLKLQAWPSNPAANHWRSEVVAFLVDAVRSFSSSMRQRITLDRLYKGAMRKLLATRDENGEPRPVPAACPYTLDELLDPKADAAALLSRLG